MCMQSHSNQSYKLMKAIRNSRMCYLLAFQMSFNFLGHQLLFTFCSSFRNLRMLLFYSNVVFVGQYKLISYNASIRSNGFVGINWFCCSQLCGWYFWNRYWLPSKIYNVSVNCVEVMTVWLAMKFASELGCPKIFIESDSARVVMRLLNPRGKWFIFGAFG